MPPRLIHSHVNYFGDGEYGLSHAIGTIKRIRAELDPYFVPLFRQQIYRYDDGSYKAFKNFGFGVGVSALIRERHNPELDDAVKPSGPSGTPLGYLGSLERAGRVSLWIPMDNRKDGTPGHCEPIDTWCFYAIKASLDYKLRLQAEAIAKAEGSLDYTATREHFRIQQEQSDARVSKMKTDAAKSFEPDKRRIKQHIRDMTAADYNQFYGEQNGFIKKPSRPFVSMSKDSK